MSRDNRVDRRSYLKIAGVGGSFALAGCLSSFGGGDDGDGGTDDGGDGSAGTIVAGTPPASRRSR